MTDIQSLYRHYQHSNGVETDTRKIRQGALFFALKGPNFNGNQFAAEALKKGAAYAVIDEPEYAISEKYLVVPNVLEVLQQLALHHRNQFHIPFLAITGSNGKTTTKELISAVLSTSYITSTTAGNLNNHIGIPLTILRIKKDTEIAIIEMGANHPGEIAAYCSIVRPTHGIITNCGKAHLEGFGSLEGVKKAKGELYDYLREHEGTIFRNTDLPYLEEMATGIKDQITYGSGNAGFTGTASLNNVWLSIRYHHQSGTQTINTRLAGIYNFANAMAAISIGEYFKVPVTKIVAAITEYYPDNARSQWLNCGSNQVILDAYNANPTSMQAAITNFAATELKNKMVWLGAMKEMGNESTAEHQNLIQLIQQYDWQQVILVGKEFEQYPSEFHWFETAADAAQFIRQNPPHNASILIKGSRSSQMELLLEPLRN